MWQFGNKTLVRILSHKEKEHSNLKSEYLHIWKELISKIFLCASLKIMLLLHN